MSTIDRFTDRMTRALAQRTSRRGVLGRIGGVLVGAAAVPLLPVARAGALPTGKNVPPATTGNPEDPGNPRSCDYWRYCGIDGFLCSCCGGSASACPPGAEMSPIPWIGTCENPADKKHYIISYTTAAESSPANAASVTEMNERSRSTGHRRTTRSIGVWEPKASPIPVPSLSSPVLR